MGLETTNLVLVDRIVVPAVGEACHELAEWLYASMAYVIEA